MGLREEVESAKRKLGEIAQTKVKVALFGQPGAGKSSLINAFVGHNAAPTGPTTDKTTKMQIVEYRGLEFCDLPGYDTTRFPKATYFETFGIMDFDLFLCVFEGKLHEADTAFFRELTGAGKVCLFVRNKADTIWQEGRTPQDLRDEIRGDIRRQVHSEAVRLHFTSCRTKEGVADLAQDIENHLDSAKRERWIRSAKAHTVESLANKREIAEKHIAWASAVSVANAFNPVPGVDLAVDLGTLLSLLHSIRADFGLDDDEALKLKANVIPVVQPLVDKLVKWSTREGLFLLLKQFAKRQTVRQIAKYIPFVGQAVAAIVGYGITVSVGDSFLETCHEAAKAILEEELKVGPCGG